MNRAFILNGAQPYPFAPGDLNATLTTHASEYLESQGFVVRRTISAEPYDVEEEIENHQWADIILMQFPVNWMSVSWSFKKYMDEVYSAGMDGRMSAGDGRTTAQPKSNYGMGGRLIGKKYMFSVTLNAPREAFDDPNESFFGGRSVDDLLYPMHLNAKFFGMTPMPTFSAHDVMKNPEIKADLRRFQAHLAEHL